MSIFQFQSSRIIPLVFAAVSMAHFQPLAAVAAEIPVGVAQKIENLVIGDNLDNLRELSVNDPVFSAERISAEPDSHGEILLNDDTKIIVGPGAEVSLDDFVVAKNGIKTGTVSILKGSFRFISGKSAKGTFSVKTPLSTIGIRGTVFDVYVRNTGETDVVLFDGQVNVCSANGTCQEINRPCDIVRVRSGNRVRKNGFLRQRIALFERRDYDLSFNQERFPEAWRAGTATCDRRSAARFNRINEDDTGEGQADVDISTPNDSGVTSPTDVTDGTSG